MLFIFTLNFSYHSFCTYFFCSLLEGGLFDYILSKERTRETKNIKLYSFVQPRCFFFVRLCIVARATINLCVCVWGACYVVLEQLSIGAYVCTVLAFLCRGAQCWYYY